jgi:hypothetical protein
VGLVKLSLHQFFLAYSEPSYAALSTQAQVSYLSGISVAHLMWLWFMQLPVVAVESYCPIVDPISGRASGHLAVLLALGSPDQVGVL